MYMYRDCHLSLRCQERLHHAWTLALSSAPYEGLVWPYKPVVLSAVSLEAMAQEANNPCPVL